jgi:hypothetical protein
VGVIRERLVADGDGLQHAPARYLTRTRHPLHVLAGECRRWAGCRVMV